MTAARDPRAVSASTGLYDRSSAQIVEELRRAAVELQRLLEVARRAIDPAAELDQVTTQAAAIAQAALRGAHAVRASQQGRLP